MPEYDDDLDDDEGESNLVRDLRKKAKRADKLEAELNTLRTERLVEKLGIDGLTPAKTKALLAAHEGSEMEPEALRKTATELGFIAEQIAEPEPQVPSDEQAALRRIAESTAGAEPSEAQVESWMDKAKQAKNIGDLTAIFAEAGILADHE